jgi:putative ABC transport system permease protein
MAGLAFGVLILSEVFYYYSYDSFYPDANRICVVNENFRMDKSSAKITTYPRVSGAIAPGLKAEVPGIEAASRLNSIGTSIFYTDDLKSYTAAFSLADEYLFDVIPRPMISGNAKEILRSPMNCMISRKIAEQIGGKVIGKIITLKEYPGKKLTIAGVFESLPENTNYKYDVLISMVSTSQFTWDGTQNWLGNDRYYACVKLSPGVKPESLAPAVRKMQEKNQDIAKLEKEQQGMILKYSFTPIRKLHVGDVKDMIIILSSIAFAVLFVSVMNYILLTLSTLINKTKTSVIHRTFGANNIDLYRLIFSDTSLLFVISLAGALLMILAMKPFAEAQLGHSLSSLLNSNVILPLVSLLIFLVFLISYLTGRFFSSIPVASAFSEFHQKRNSWKRILLSFQFAGSAFILAVLVVVTLQYDKMWNADHGYRTKGIYFGSTSGMEGRKISTVINELRSMPEVEQVALGSCIPIEGASGNNVLSPDGTKEMFNFADFYWIDENYLTMMGIPVLKGQNFSAETALNDVIISRKGSEMLMLNNGWNDGVTGKQITVTEHGNSTIKGVYSDFVINSISDPDLRPSIFYYMPESTFEKRETDNPAFSFNIFVRLHERSQAGMRKKITDVFNMALPYKDAVIKSLEEEQVRMYIPERGFRNAMMAGNIIILLITALGLLGYTTNEAARRSKELAVRRINGAAMSDILRMFNMDLIYVAVPSIIIGLIAAWFTAGKWMVNFASRIPLHWSIFFLCSVIILSMIIFLASVNYMRIAVKNPVEALRYE